MRILGFGAEDSLFIILEELTLNAGVGLQVDQTVRHYDASGEYLGVARVPLTEQYTYVQQGIALGSDGEVYYLATRPDGAEIRRLSFEKNIPSILFEEPAPSDMPIPAVNQTDESRSCVSRNTIVSTAYGYITNSKYLSSTNINGSGCGNRVKPRYLGSVLIPACHTTGVALTRLAVLTTICLPIHMPLAILIIQHQTTALVE